MTWTRRLIARLRSTLEQTGTRLSGAPATRCSHRTHQEMLAARSYCPDCRRRYVAWAESVGLATVYLDGTSPDEWSGF